MANKYRFILGKHVDNTTNLVTNGTFTGGLSGWTAGSAWSSVSNTADFINGSQTDGNDYNLRQSGIVIPGNTYFLSYDLKKGTSATPVSVGGNGNMAWSVGGTYYAPWIQYDTNSTTSFITQTHENIFCAHGNDLVFNGAIRGRFFITNGAIDNVILYPYTWNDPLVYEPINWNNAKITKQRDKLLNGLLVNYIADLVFIEDGFDFLYGLYLSDGYCAEVPIRVEELNSTTGQYSLFFQGFIYLSEANFNISKRQVQVNIEDVNASKIFSNNKDVKVDSIPAYLGDIINYQLEAPDAQMIIDFNDDTGVYPVTPNYANRRAINIFNLLRRVIMIATNYRLDSDSVFFSSGTFENFAIIKANNIYTVSPNPPNLDRNKISIGELFMELDNLFNLTFSIDTSSVIPVVNIEPKIEFLSSTPVMVLNYVDNLEFSFDTENIVKAINIGYEKIDSTPTELNFNTPEGNQYFTSNLCASETMNKVSKFVQNSVVIKRILDGTINEGKYYDDWVWIETDGALTINSGSADYDFNINIEEEDNVQRQVETLNTDYLKSTEGNVELVIPTSPSLPLIYKFEYPITKGQLDSIIQPYNTIEFNTDGTGATTKTGYLIRADYDIRTGVTKFELLSN